MTECEYRSIIDPSGKSDASSEDFGTSPSPPPSTIPPSTAIADEVDSSHTLTDYTGPNTFFASLSAHHAYVAQLRGAFGNLEFVIAECNIPCSESRSHLHQQTLQKLQARINGRADIINYATFDTAINSEVQQLNAENDDIRLRILRTGRGDSKATLQIGDTRGNGRLKVAMWRDTWTGDVPTMQKSPLI
jgi:hypothetical protein